MTDENSSLQNGINYVNHEFIDFVKDKKDIGLTQDLQENVESVQSISVATKIIEGEVDDYSIQHSLTSPHEESIQDIDIYDIAEMPDIPTRIADDQVIEEFKLQEEIDSQGINECKTEELQEIPIEVANEQEIEEYIEDVVSDITLPEVYRPDENIHTNVKLEIPEIKSEERYIVQDELKLVQDRTLIFATPNPLQTNAQAQYMTEQKVSLPDKAIIGKIIPLTHVGRIESLRSEAVRKEVSTYIVSICRPPSKPPDKQNSLEGEINKKTVPDINPINRPPPKPSNTQIIKGKRKWVFRKKPYMKSDYRPPPKPPYKPLSLSKHHQ